MSEEKQQFCDEIFNGKTIFTYRQMLNALLQMPSEQLDQDITIEDIYQEEYCPGELGITNNDVDLLDKNHLIIMRRF